MRKISLLILFTLFLTTAVTAQNETDQNGCGSLSEQDCQFLQSARQTMPEVGSSAFILQLNVIDHDAAQTEPFLLALTLDGTYSVNQEAVSSPTSGDSDVTQQEIARTVTDLLNSLSADAHGSLVAPGDSDPSNLRRSVVFDVRMADGVAYLDLNSVNQPDDAVESDWRGVRIVDLINYVGGSRNPDFQGLLSALMEGTLLIFGAAEREGFSDYTDVVRLETVNQDVVASIGQDVAVFVHPIDFAGVFNDPETETAARNIYAPTAGDEQAFSDQELTDRYQQTRQIFENASGRYTEYIGVDDQYVYRRELVLSNLSLSIDEGGQARNVDIAIGINFDNFNGVEAVTVPDSATVVPIEDLSDPLSAFFAQPQLPMVNIDSEGTSPENMSEAEMTEMPAEDVLPETTEQVDMTEPTATAGS